MNVLIVTGGYIENKNILTENKIKYNYVICADGGSRYIELLNIIPNIILGDFDSSDRIKIKEYEQKGIEVQKFPTKKDKTDTELAIDFALTKNPQKITMVGATGTRIDHTVANIHILKKCLEKGVSASIIDDNNTISIINKQILIKKGQFKYLSLLPLTSKVEGITLKGTAYELSEATLSCGSSVGVSNEIVGEEAVIQVRSGILIVIQSRD